MDKNHKIKKCMADKEKIYELKVENINIEIIYSKGNKKIEECILNVLKKKMKSL